jgi:O-acetyl-ADP-ribose deacetylase (regulator of RNase III)
VAQIHVWHGDICELEVEAIVVPAVTSLWMATGVAGAVKRAGGERIEFEAIRQGPVPLGAAVVTGGGSLAARWVIHAVTLDRDRRTSAATIAAAVRSAMGQARRLEVRSLAIPALGSGVGGFPLDEGARVTVETVRQELPRCPSLETVVFALKGSAAYRAFEAAVAASDQESPGPREERGGLGVERFGPGAEQPGSDVGRFGLGVERPRGDEEQSSRGVERPSRLGRGGIGRVVPLSPAAELAARPAIRQGVLQVLGSRDQ